MKESTFEKETANSMNIIPCSLWRRLLVMSYDLTLLFCVVFIFWIPMAFLPHELMPPMVSRFIRLLYLVLVCFGFYGWFWTHGGQTLGMRSWKVQLVSEDSTDINWWHAWRRYSSSYLSWFSLGIGFLWSLFDADKKCWHDYLSKTRLIRTD